MIIESMELENYRNYRSLQVEFDSGTNIFYGDNAQGKTNILEAAYLCCTAKSHRGAKDREIIRFGEEESHIKLQIRKDNVPYRIDMHLKKNKTKGIAINGVPIKKASQLFGIANVVFFSPEDLNIIKNGPAERRRFLDLELCQVNRLYVHSLIHYNKTVVQRNKLLKELFIHPEYELTLDVWDEQLLTYGLQVMEFRRQFIEQLNRMIGQIHQGLTGGKENLVLQYEPNTKPEEFKEGLRRNREQDKKQKTTLTGPHRDDLLLTINGAAARVFGSQGQQRSAVLALKLAEAAVLEEIIGEPPVVLLDDVMSELDTERQEYLLNHLQGRQIFITCCDPANVRLLEQGGVFQVQEGSILQQEKGVMHVPSFRAGYGNQNG